MKSTAMTACGILLPIWNVRETVAIRRKAEVFCSDGALPGLTDTVEKVLVIFGEQ
jgi:hypothetical protein